MTIARKTVQANGVRLRVARAEYRWIVRERTDLVRREIEALAASRMAGR